MEIIQNIIEYYDELYPVTESQKKFYRDLAAKYPVPTRFLRVGCGTGLLEHTLAKDGYDVTGIETYKEILHSANLRRRNQLMSIRFFQMSYMDMSHFLGKGFYNIISSLDDRILFIHDHTLMRKFFFDCRQLLTEDGCLVIQLSNLGLYKNVPLAKLPNRESVRAKLFTEINTDDAGNKYITQNVETGNGKVLPVMTDMSVYPLVPDEISDLAKEAGFKSVELYADWDKTPFTGNEPSVIALIH